ncbi:MAG: hypothetical protein M1812_000686 [Candelaria pacifica]|nr:MAG: hypothetical protein M1812_000686 [Candelaria pacifica]
MGGKGILYKWEDSPALDHKCGTCKTVLSSPRAKKTCFGIHEEVCSKYHNTMFFVGEAHKCEACRKSAELHDKRLREIGALHESLKQLDAASQPSKRKDKMEQDEDVLPVEPDISTGPSALVHDETTEGTSTPNRKRLCKTEKKAIKEKKALKKAADRAKSHPQIKVLTTEHVKSIHNAIHVTKSKPVGNRSHSRNNSSILRKEGIIAENLSYNSKTFDYHKWTAERKPDTKSTPNSKAGSKYQEVPSEILARLGVEINVPGASRERKSVVTKLCEAICNHLTIVENEDRETKMREGGYWRYVNKKTLNQMNENNKVWCWKTGVKMPLASKDETPAGSDEHDDSDQGNDVEEVEDGMGEIQELAHEHLADQETVAFTKESLDDDALWADALQETLCADTNKNPIEEVDDDSAKDSASSTVDSTCFVVNLEPESLFE